MFLIYSIFLGTIMGIITFIFGTVLLTISNFRDQNHNIVILLPIIGAIIFYLYITYAPKLRQGMKMIKESYMIENSHIDKKLIPFITISTWLSHLFGASVGREGVAVQIGASFSNLTYKYFKVKKHEAILAGMSSGFAGLFGTPLAAIIFPLEIMHRKDKKLNYKSFFIIIISSFISSFTSNFLGLSHFKVHITEKYDFSIKILFVVILASILFSISAVLFNKIIRFLKPHFSKNLKTVFLLSIILTTIIYLFRDIRYAGLGTNLILMSFKNNGNAILSFDFLFKLLLTCFSLSLSYQGGEVTPLFAIGASLGVSIAMFFNAPVYLLAAIGYATVFSGATNTLITPILIGYEVFGLSIIPYLILASVLVYILTGKNSIY